MIKDVTASGRRALVDDARDVIAREYGEPLSVAYVARAVATSPRQLQRALADSGTTFRAELLRVRMTEAARLLRETETPVREAGERVGYREPAQFAKTFKRFHGVSPSRYRAGFRAAG